MDIETKWKEFVEEISSKMETSDAIGAMLLRETLLRNIPPNKASMEWAKAYVTFQHNCFEFVDFCRKVGKTKEALLILSLMEDTNNALMVSALEEDIKVTKEFVKEVKF